MAIHPPVYNFKIITLLLYVYSSCRLLIIISLYNRLESEAIAANEEKIRKDAEDKLAAETDAEISRLLLENELQVSKYFIILYNFQDSYWYIFWSVILLIDSLWINFAPPFILILSYHQQWFSWLDNCHIFFHFVHISPSLSLSLSFPFSLSGIREC